MPRSPEIFDPYVGKVYGNILDQYDNPTYNIKIAIIPATAGQPSTSNTSTTAGTESGAAARETATPTFGPGVLPPSFDSALAGAPASSTASQSTIRYVPGVQTAKGARLPQAGTGTFDQNLTELNAYILTYTEGLRTSENSRAGGTTKSLHTGDGHNTYDSAFDVNFKYGYGDKSTVSAAEAAVLDPLNAQLIQAGYKTIWRTDGHYNHLHVEIPDKFANTQLGFGQTGTSTGTGSGTGGSGGTTADGDYRPPPAEERVPEDQQVIIAQTGVTAVTVDDLVIEMAPHPKLNFFTTNFQFTLTQPGAANLLDQIRLARAYVGAENTDAFHFLIEVSFVGYTSSPEDNAAGGEPTLIAGPFSWRVTTATVTAEVTPAGSVYRFEATNASSIDGPGSADSYNDMVFRIPKHLSTEGATITEHVASLESSLNDYLQQNCTAYSAPDKYKFDLSRLLKTGGSTMYGSSTDYRIQDQKIATNNDPSAEKTGVASNNQVPLQDADQAKEDNREAKKVAGTNNAEQLHPGGKLDVSEQTTLEDYFAKLLNMNKEFRSKISNLVDIDDPTSKVDPTKIFTAWFTIEIDTVRERYDPKRGDYTKTYIVRPVVYGSPRPDIQRLTINESSDEDLATSELAANAKLEQIIAENRLHKSYKYFFTGENDQIIDFNITFDNAGTVIIAPPRRGYIGDTSVTNAVALNPTLPATGSADIGSLIKNSVDRVKNAQTLVNFLQTLATDSRQAFAAALGQTEEQLKAIVSDSSGKAAEALAKQVDAVTLAKASRSITQKSGDNSTTPTSGTGVNLDGSTYTPEASGRIYAEDLVNLNFAGALTFDQIAQAGLIKMQGKNPDDVFRERQKINNVNTLSSPGESSTYSEEGIGNSLFSYIHQQHATKSFLATVDLTLRGDPWYLGKATNSLASTPDQSKQDASVSNYFLLTVASPLPYDLDVRDEDSNSGYWNMNGMSQSFSGLYHMTGVTNQFSGGKFTTTINQAYKDYAIPLYKIRPLKPGEAPENYIRPNGVDVSKNPEQYLYKGEVAGGTGATGGPIEGTAPAGKPLGKTVAEQQANEELYWKALEAQEKDRRLAAGLPATFSEAERRAINGILASEGGDPGANLATMLNRSYQSSDALNRAVPVNEIVFATNQFTPASAASIGVDDVVAGSDPRGAARFVGGYNAPATTNLSAAIGSYQDDLQAGVNYFRSDKATPGAAQYSVVDGQIYSIGKPGNFAIGDGKANEQVFYQRNKIPPASPGPGG